MTTVRRQIAESLSDKRYRETLVKQHLSRWTAFQLRQMREDHDWTQAELASLVGMQQSSISDLEKPGKRQPTIDTLTRIAAGLDVALLVEYVPFSRFVNHMASEPHVVPGISPEAMSVHSYDDDAPLQEFLSEREVTTAVNAVGSLVSMTAAHRTAYDTLEAFARSLNEDFELATGEAPIAPPANRVEQGEARHDRAA